MKGSLTVFRCSWLVVATICLAGFIFLLGPDMKADKSPQVVQEEKIGAPIRQVKADKLSKINEKEKIGVPARLKIPTIAVDALIEKVGLAQDGSMGTPEKAQNTGWYELGVRPGDVGSAVIDGHLNWYHGASGVFENLHNVQPGDIISVEDDSGDTINFIVRESRYYDANADTTDIFSSKDGKAHLNLITCGGTWNKKTQQYTKRLVIFADRE